MIDVCQSASQARKERLEKEEVLYDTTKICSNTARAHR